MCNHPWYHGQWNDYALCLVLKYQVLFTALLKPKPQNVAEPPRKERNACPPPFFFSFLTDFILPDQSTAPTVGAAPSSASEEQNKKWIQILKRRKDPATFTAIEPHETVREVMGQCNAIVTSIYIYWANNTVHKNRIDKREKKWWSMVWLNTSNTLFSPFTLLFHICSLFAFYKDLELDLRRDNQGAWGVCCHPWTAHCSLKSELCWEGRQPR